MGKTNFPQSHRRLTPCDYEGDLTELNQIESNRIEFEFQKEKVARQKQRPQYALPKIRNPFPRERKSL